MHGLGWTREEWDATTGGRGGSVESDETTCNDAAEHTHHTASIRRGSPDVSANQSSSSTPSSSWAPPSSVISAASEQSRRSPFADTLWSAVKNLAPLVGKSLVDEAKHPAFKMLGLAVERMPGVVDQLSPPVVSIGYGGGGGGGE